jgi:curved DNA-binding protein CbpA
MFHNCKSEDEAKKLFRKLCLLLHPDKGGSHELMILLNEAYELYLKPKIKNPYSREEPKKSQSDKIFMGDDRLDIIEELNDLQEEHDFSSDYFESVMAFLNARKYITQKQYEGLQGVLRNWKGRAK